MRKLQITIVGVVAMLTLVCWLFTDTIPPKNLTETRMRVTRVRLMKYAAINNALPRSLSQLPPEPDRDNALVDDWGHPIIYTVDLKGQVTLSSFGRDGKAGGGEDDADIVRRFMSRKPDGTWSDEFTDWLRPSS